MENNEKREFIFIWEIENYSLCGQRNGKSIRSPVFAAQNLSCTRWFLELYPNGDHEYSKEYVSCFLFRSRNDICVNNMEIFCKMDITDTNNKIIESACFGEERVFKKEGAYNNGVGFTRFIKISDLKDEMQQWPKDVLTIRCYIQGKKPASCCKIKTLIELDNYSFTWNVENPNSIKWLKNKRYVISEKSYVEVFLSAPANDIVIKIKKLHCPSSLIHCRITLVKAGETEGDSRSDTYMFKSNKDTWEFPNFIKKDNLNNEKHSYTKNGFFTLKFEFSFSNGEQSVKNHLYTNGTPMTDFSTFDNFRSLSEDLSNRMYTYEYFKLADVTLVVNNENILAHKIILSARSPVFSAMFRKSHGDEAESQIKRINITDLNKSTVIALLNFMYYGRILEMSFEIASNLLMAAHKYRVSSLKETCCNFLKSVLSLENACDVLTLAAETGCSALKDSSFDLIMSNPLEVLSSAGWVSWIKKNSRLGFEITSKLTARLQKELR